jgi:hypothetical protein
MQAVDKQKAAAAADRQLQDVENLLLECKAKMHGPGGPAGGLPAAGGSEAGGGTGEQPGLSRQDARASGAEG